jgi:mevalonate kinase
VVPSLNEVTASAPAKVILFGEHFVVYGEPAIVLAIDKRAYASVKTRRDSMIHIDDFTTPRISGYFEKNRFAIGHGSQDTKSKLKPIKDAVQKVLEIAGENVGIDVEIRCSIPIAAGLGSSAAVIAAVAKATSHLLDVKLSNADISNITFESERLVHGTPSGIDPTITTYGGVLLFRRGKRFSTIDVKKDIPLIIGNTEVKHSTGELVSMVRQRREKYPLVINPIIETSGKIVAKAVNALENYDLTELGELMNINQGLLCAIGVSTDSLEKLVYAAREAGAYGAKLTGAGGGGCIVALSPPEKNKQIAEAIEKTGGKAFAAKKSDEGVRLER